MSCSDPKNPLQLGGTSQLQRMPDALKQGYVQIDEREFVDWIDFASRFAKYLNYYSSANIATGDWQPFFDNDISAILGTIAIQDINAYKDAVKTRFDLLKSNEHDNDLTLLKTTLGALFSGILTYSLALDTYIFRLPDGHSLKTTIQNLIKLKLQPALSKLLAYYKGGQSNKNSNGTTNNALVIITNSDVPDWIILNRSVIAANILISTQTLSPIWLDGAGSLPEFYNALSPDKSIYGDDSWAPNNRINHAANHNLFAGLFDQYLSSYARLIQDAEAALLQSLVSYNTHPPHYTLFLTFLQLFKNAQDSANTITQRHLDFYYKEVLRIMPKDAVPDNVHLIMELAKNVDVQLLKQGTLFKAGKDSLGKEISYSLAKDTLFNKAVVAQLKSVYLSESKVDDINKVFNLHRVFASSVTNSADGNGAALTSPFKEWQPFAGKSFINGKLTAINMPKAEIGLAISSPYLFMTEGERHARLELDIKEPFKKLPDTLAADGYLTTAKGWFKIPITVNVQHGVEQIRHQVNFHFALTGADPAITNFDPKLHTGAYKIGEPALKIILRNEDEHAFDYHKFRDVVMTDITLYVYAGMGEDGIIVEDGLKNLKLSNDQGALDSSKPFLPFGNAPKAGASLFVGNEELFKKPAAKFELRMKWMELPSDGTKLRYPSVSSGFLPSVKLEVLAKGGWKIMFDASTLINSDAKTINPVIDFPGYPIAPFPNDNFTDHTSFLAYDEPYKAYDINSKNGFLKLTLNAGFGQELYQSALTKFLIKGGTDPLDPPYVPKLQSLTLHYYASTTLALAQPDMFFPDDRYLTYYQVYPFGEDQFVPYAGELTTTMLPQFSQVIQHEAHIHNAEWYIGLQNLQADQSVNILVQVLEGTSNPLTIKPADHVSWSYLSNNNWQLFDKQNVTDNTAQLIQSGIISFIIPSDATTDNTVMPTGILWLRASVHEAVDAVCDLLSVDAQAALATFSNNGNAPDVQDLPLAAGTISKMKEPLAAIKKTTQPYPSFGGRPTENPTQYYTRVSERLRHKDRAITIWDYERLILEAFPELHRVKCLNHTKYETEKKTKKVYNEVAPGHVTIITIPSLSNRNDANPLRPYTSESTLVKISDFLAKRISCHVTTHVTHPHFEDVVMDFKLKLMAGFEYNFYSNLLRNELTSFLTPWAYGKSEDIQFGGKVQKSVVINFIEERPYVDYITEVKMYQHLEGEPYNVLDIDEAIASKAISIMVSAPAEKHLITGIVDTTATAAQVVCVDTYNHVT